MYDKSINAYINGRVCGIVVLYSSSTMTPKDKCHLLRALYRAIMGSYRKRYCAFLVALLDENDAFCLQFLLHLLSSLPNFFVYAIVPPKTEPSCKVSTRKKIDRLMDKVDAYFYSDIPLCDFNINIAITCDHLIICSVRSPIMVNDFLEDLSHIYHTCSIEVSKR